MKRFGLAIAISGIALFGAAACGGGEQATPPPTAATPRPSVPPTQSLASPVPSPVSTSRPSVIPTPTPQLPQATATVQAQQYRYGGVINYAVNSPAVTRDIHQTSSGVVLGQGPGQAYSALLSVDAGPRVQGMVITSDLAESWKFLDNTTLQFKIRQGVKWHDLPPVNGRELIADDVLYSLRRQATAGFANAGLIQSVDLTKSSAPDRYTVTLVMARPDPDILVNLSAMGSGIVAKEVVDRFGDLRQAPIIGTGAWIHIRTDSVGSEFFKRNPNFYRKGFYGEQLPHAEEMNFLRVADEATRVAALYTGAIDIISLGNVTNADLDPLVKQRPGVTLAKYVEYGNGPEFALNAKAGPLQDARVRQAVLKGINHKAIVEGVWGGLGRLTAHLPVPNTSYMLPEAERERMMARDVNGAKRLLQEAGFGRGLDLKLSIGNYGQAYPSAGAVMQQDLKDIGVNLTLDVVTTTVFQSTTKGRKQYEAYIGPISPFPTINGELYGRHYSTAPANVFNIQDKDLDRLIDAQAVELDPSKRAAAVQSVERKQLDLAYWWGVVTLERVVGYRGDRLRDFYPPSIPLINRLPHLELVWVAR